MTEFLVTYLVPIWTICDADRQYGTHVTWGSKLIPNYTSGTPSYEIGLYLVLLGYIIVIIGGVWDTLQKRREEKLNIVPSQTNAQVTPSIERKRAA